MAADPISLHVTCYQNADRLGGAEVWLVTPLAPSESIDLLGWPPGWPNGSPLADLVVQLIDDFDNPVRWKPDALMGTLVLLPTTAHGSFREASDDVRMMELYSSDANPAPCRGDLHERLRHVHRSNGRELLDLVAAIGHRLPLWPAGCATTELVATWELDPEVRISGGLPPPLESVRAFAQRCESVARSQADPISASLRALGSAWWTISAGRWAQGNQHSGALPEKCDPAVWQVPVQFQLPTTVAYVGPLFDGLDWLMEQSPSRRLAEDALAIFGDPSSAGIAVMDLDSLPRQVRALLEQGTRPSKHPPTSLRARRVVEALDHFPGAVHGVRTLEWVQPGGPVWCADIEGTSLFAFHVSRRAAAEAESVYTPVGHSGPVPGPTNQSQVGRAIEVAFVPTVSGGGASRGAVGFIITDSDQLLLLPAIGDAGELASAIEHMTWHEGRRSLPVGLPPVHSRQLANAVAARLQGKTALVSWERLGVMVGDHPDERAYCYYCRQQEGGDA
ncbi:hypothetical protein [Kitasatospora purpeofusca]|uniref:hypothetical protein n=1 Tax=Kitasatospora purpeofusca TaxID=67352 RepID=UPI0036C30688